MHKMERIIYGLRTSSFLLFAFPPLRNLRNLRNILLFGTSSSSPELPIHQSFLFVNFLFARASSPSPELPLPQKTSPFA
ncbi:hypothetical protein BJ322DRAFT_1106733 [Thelephora terrestris]|uniref:Uncharacterized protein n=1 Tax=Thelephora terrestris TaxID=56493 RepID=A0A9P6L9V4_9AGAM|nr:hypothetical protein BJ322DRAFT_1106733 [Thelephora terrestris]